MAPAMKWMAKKTESEEKPAKGKGGGKAKKESNKGSSGKDKGSSQSWWNDWEYDSWGWDWGSKPKSKKGKGEEEKGSKGKSKGKYDEEEKKGKGKGGKGKEKGDWPPNGAKTVAEVEAEMNKGKIERVKRNPDSVGKQPVEATGSHCQVHKHSGMGCAVVSLANHETKEAIMNYAEKTFGRSAAGKLEMDIADVKVQLKRHKDKGSGREVLTDIFVAWGHQQEKDSPLTVDEIAEFFDKLYEDTMNAPPGATAPPVPAAPGAAGAAAAAMMAQRGLRPPPPPAMHMPHHPPQPNPYYNAMYANMMNPAMGAMNPYMQQQFAAQQAQAAAYAAYHQQMAQQQQQWQQHMYDAKGKWGGKGMKGKGKDKGSGPETLAAVAAPDAAAAAPTAPAAEGEAAKAEASAEGGEPPAVPGVPDFSPPKPRLLQIVDPTSGKPIDTISMNFAPRKPSTPLQIKNPTTGEAVDVEGAKS